MCPTSLEVGRGVRGPGGRPSVENRVMGEYRHVAEDEWEAGMPVGSLGDRGRAPNRLQQAMVGADR
jgi:hypothetical protein